MILVWFGAIGLLGLEPGRRRTRQSSRPCRPRWGAQFLINNGVAGYLALGGVVLAVTGAEALYADRGHFGAAPIRMGWFAVALPALMLNYLGQGVLILHDPSAAANPFYLMAPAGPQYPMLFLATAATIIASQAAISGSFSVARQAMQLGFLPRLTIRHPRTRGSDLRSDRELGALCRRRRADAGIPIGGPARRHLRRRGHGDVRSQHGALPRRCALPLGHVEVEARPRRRRSS